MKISIITPTYNDAAFLKGSIESVLSQSHRDFEHIVVDGGSTDGTIELLKSYPHIKWISEKDRGMYDAINKGIKMSSGQIISYLNSDDRYRANTLGLVHEAIQNEKKVEFVYGYCEYIDENERAICTFKPVHVPNSIARKVRITWAQPCCFWKREVHEKIGFFDASMKLVGDLDFFRRILVNGRKGKLIKEPLARFMVRKGCISKQMADEYKNERRAIEKKFWINSRRWQYITTEGIWVCMNLVSILKYQLAKWNNRF